MSSATLKKATGTAASVDCDVAPRTPGKLEKGTLLYVLGDFAEGSPRCDVMPRSIYPMFAFTVCSVFRGLNGHRTVKHTQVMYEEMASFAACDQTCWSQARFALCIIFCCLALSAEWNMRPAMAIYLHVPRRLCPLNTCSF